VIGYKSFLFWKDIFLGSIDKELNSDIDYITGSSYKSISVKNFLDLSADEVKSFMEDDINNLGGLKNAIINNFDFQVDPE